MSSRHVAVVPHTHWDREWYEPFQTFRLRLVELIDQLIPLLENDPSYERYLLDGQMAVIDDYLEIRPEMKERLRRLAASGRVAVGPWYILVDEFLVSGETIIRDLQLGIDKGAEFGGVTSVGYLPDMFGHIAQMPQILQQAGFEHTVLWRGVPSAITKSGFQWVSPDGSSVRAEYLVAGYGNGASLPTDAKDLVRRVNDHLQDVGSFLFSDLLYMNGSDHLMPQGHLGRVLAEANEIQDELHFKVSSLAEYLQRAPTDNLQRWDGELRSGFRSNILMGVLSNRVDVKRLGAQTERAIENRAEPYAALFGAPENYPHAVLAVAWREIIRNAAHDSVCACSVDETVDAVIHRYHEARQIANGVSQRALDFLAHSMAAPGLVVVNGAERERSGLVEAVVAGNQFDATTMQVVDVRGALPDSMLLDAAAVRAILSVIEGTRVDENTWVQSVEVGDSGDELTLAVTVGPYEIPDVDLDRARLDLMGRLGAKPEAFTRVTLKQPEIRRVIGHVASVPPFGWTPFAPVAPDQPVESSGERSLDNGLVRVEALDDGTFSVNGVGGYGRLVDGGDLGDSYNYSPPAHDRLIDAPTSVVSFVVDPGPVRGRVLIVANYEWPQFVEPLTQDRTGTVSVEVTTVVELRANDPVVRVETSFVNPSRDHRLRVHFPLPTAARTSQAECAFTVIERGLEAEGRPEEFGLPTFPSRRFVVAGGLTVVHEGLHEYELVDIDESGAHQLALTLLRSTGMLSRLGMALRPFPAGPLTPVAGLQMVGATVTSRYGLCVQPCDPYAVAQDVLQPLETVAAQGGGWRATRGTALDITGAQVSAVRRVEGVLEVRVFNPLDQETTVNVPQRRGWLVDLRGRAVEPFEGAFVLRPHGIATLRLREGE